MPKSNLKPPRFTHSLGVANMAIKLSRLHNLKISNRKIVTAALLHDITKEMNIDEQIELLKKYKPEFVSDELMLSLPVIHAFSGSVIAKLKYEVDDEDILNAICYHTTGRSNMSDLEKCAKRLTSPKGRTAITKDIARIYIFDQNHKQHLIGVLYHKRIKSFAPMYDKIGYR